MNRPELYHKTVDILVQAYFNDTLEHGNCYACAVGNIVAANMGIEFIKGDLDPVMWDGCVSNWDDVFKTALGAQRTKPWFYAGEAQREIDSTGYTWKQLARIEFAFETAPRCNSDDEWMFNGLMAVIEALDEIHDNKDPEVSTKSKNRFAKV